MEVALLIEFDLSTGRRPGGIDPRDPGLRCYGWQNLDTIPAKEIRLIVDGRDPKQYEGIEGIKILWGRDEINKAIQEHIPERYVIENPALFQLHLQQKGISLDQYAGKSTQEVLRELYGMGVLGIRKMAPKRVEEVIGK